MKCFLLERFVRDKPTLCQQYLSFFNRTFLGCKTYVIGKVYKFELCTIPCKNFMAILCFYSILPDTVDEFAAPCVLMIPSQRSPNTVYHGLIGETRTTRHSKRLF